MRRWKADNKSTRRLAVSGGLVLTNLLLLGVGFASWNFTPKVYATLNVFADSVDDNLFFNSIKIRNDFALSQDGIAPLDSSDKETGTLSSIGGVCVDIGLNITKIPSSYLNNKVFSMVGSLISDNASFLTYISGVSGELNSMVGGVDVATEVTIESADLAASYSSTISFNVSDIASSSDSTLSLVYAITDSDGKIKSFYTNPPTLTFKAEAKRNA